MSEPGMVGSHYVPRVTGFTTTCSAEIDGPGLDAQRSLAEAFDPTTGPEDRERLLRAAEVSATLAQAAADRELARATREATAQARRDHHTKAYNSGRSVR